MKWKGRITEGINYDPMVSSMDIFHSVVEASDIHLPVDREYDGVSLLPYLSGQLKSDPHDILFWQRGFSKAVRTREWKLLLNEDSGDTLLYPIAQDPVENKDVSAAHPLISEKLLEKHAQWSSDLKKPLWPSEVYYQYREGDLVFYFDQ
jgi:uncharacterized sulfatase